MARAVRWTARRSVDSFQRARATRGSQGPKLGPKHAERGRLDVVIKELSEEQEGGVHVPKRAPHV